MSIHSDEDLLGKIEELIGKYDGTGKSLREILEDGMAWVVLTRLEAFLHAKVQKPVMEKGDEPTERWRGAGGWAVVFQSEKYEKPTSTEEVYVVRVDEPPGEAPGEVTRSSTGEKKRLRAGCVQQYREQARVLRRRLIKEMKLRAACSFADQYDSDDYY